MIKHWQVDQLRVELYATIQDLACAAAKKVANTIQAAVLARGEARVIFATGNSQLAFLQELTQRQAIPWGQVTAFHLDEYIGLEPEHPASFRHYLHTHLVSRVALRAFHAIDGQAENLADECERYTALLAQAPLDLACVGIGENGHLAFNDPPADFGTPAWVHVVELDERARQQQVGEGHFAALQHVPLRAITLSIPAIMQVAKIVAIVPEQRKASAVAATLQIPISPDCPASQLRNHSNADLFLDSASAAQLEFSSNEQQ